MSTQDPVTRRPVSSEASSRKGRVGMEPSDGTATGFPYTFPFTLGGLEQPAPDAAEDAPSVVEPTTRRP